MYNIKIAEFAFKCPISGDKVRRGDIYIEDEEGNMYSISQLPTRNLIPIKQYKNGPEIAVKSN
jgi:hypothetical protein